jgi:ADP-ribose pyrophosphatase YjhB (NUDIX family)
MKRMMSYGVILKDRKLLLMIRSDYGVWGIPCGGLEPGET